VDRPDTSGKAINVCPQAGAYINVCYARNGTFNFPRVKAAHIRNLEMIRYDLSSWMTTMMDELAKTKYRPTGRKILPRLSRSHLSLEVAALLNNGSACIRIHDSGDFFSTEYLISWLTIASSTPDVLFYCYQSRDSACTPARRPPRVGYKDHAVRLERSLSRTRGV
jgi:hypothetical protein